MPVLTGVFKYSAKQAVALNLAISLFTVVAAIATRASVTSLHSLQPIVTLLCMLGIGSLLGRMWAAVICFGFMKWGWKSW